MRVGVTALAEFARSRGDLRARQGSAALAQEGVARQREWQRGRGESYLREHRVRAAFGELEVSGRIDGWDPLARLVEEVKTTRGDATALHAHEGDVHWAQLRLYAAMLALADDSLDALQLRLVYLHPDVADETTFEAIESRDDLIAYFEAACALLAAWIGLVSERLRARDAQLSVLRFPYADFRPDQRLLAKHVYRSLRDRADWLVEAPTGSGKTIASLFPALKAMGEGALDRLLFVTARGTGQRAALDALGRLAAQAELSAVVLTAKERICFVPGAPCDPAHCAYARGYYERLPAARRALLEGGLARRGRIEAVARAHRVCPFALSVEAASWADVVVCDYNYVFDPVAQLTRLRNEALRPGAGRIGLIVDEAHQLGERVRDMLGVRLERGAVKAALREPGLPALAVKRLRSVDRALAALARNLRDADAADPPASEIAKPLALGRAVARLCATLPALTKGMEALPAARQARWLLPRFERALDGSAEGGYRFLASGAGDAFGVEAVCTAPGGRIREAMAPFHGTVRLSGTLTPERVFQRVHGFAGDAGFLRSDGAFDPRRLGLFVVPDVSTYARDRARTLPTLADLIDGVRRTTPGNCLVALPSFAYLDAVADAAGGANVRRQTQRMAQPDKESFVEWLSKVGSEETPRAGFVVTGGMFAESVDFDSRALRAVIVVGPGLAPRSPQRDLIAADAARRGDDGDELAYRQPAMTRVAQAVGRIARRVDERGLAVLVDPRFGWPRYRGFLPPRWRIRAVPARRVPAEAAKFWSAPGSDVAYSGRHASQDQDHLHGGPGHQQL